MALIPAPVPLLAAACLGLAPLPQEPDEPRDAPQRPARRTGVLRRTEEAFEGYNLIAPLLSERVYLVDMAGEVVHAWDCPAPPGLSVYLLDDGDLLHCGRTGDLTRFGAPGAGGVVHALAPDGRVVWEYRLPEGLLQHHDVEPMPNGNLLVLAWEERTAEEALAAGRNPERVGPLGLWPDCVFEVEPVRPKGGKIVWEWRLWDHLVQDLDRTKRNYAPVARHPERVDVNGDQTRRPETAEERSALQALGYLGGDEEEDEETARNRGRADWTHANAIDYHPELDQVALSVRMFSEIWVIDHSTTTAQAAGHEGGRYGRGGDLLYRWGNPRTYRAGGKRHQRLFAQHDVQWIEPGLPGAGNLLVYNNGFGRPGRSYSSVVELAPPLARDGSYRHTAGQRFAPEEPELELDRAAGRRFYSGHISGAQRLPDGHTLVCVGESGRLLELDADGAVHWEYVSPHTGDDDAAGPRSFGASPTALFRATRLAPDHPGVRRLLGTADDG